MMEMSCGDWPASAQALTHLASSSVAMSLRGEPSASIA